MKGKSLFVWMQVLLLVVAMPLSAFAVTGDEPKAPETETVLDEEVLDAEADVPATVTASSAAGDDYIDSDYIDEEDDIDEEEEETVEE